MKFVYFFTFLGWTLISCSSKSPIELAKQTCSCYSEAKSIQNTTKQLRKMDECFKLMQKKLEQLQQIGIDCDWNEEQVEKARKEFDDAYDQCSVNTSKETINTTDKDDTNTNIERTESTPTEINLDSFKKYDKATIEREIKLIQKKFYSIDYNKLNLDSISSNSPVEVDKIFVYSDNNGNVIKISETMQGASIVQTIDYYFSNNSLYFIYSSTSPTNTNPSGYEKRVYIYNNDIIKTIENGYEVHCKENCKFSLQSKPYRLLRLYLGQN